MIRWVFMVSVLCASPAFAQPSDAAAPELSEASRTVTDAPDRAAHLAAAEAAVAAGDWAAAASAYGAAVREDPAVVDTWYRLGVAHALAGDAASAAVAFRQVRERVPTFPEIDDRIAAADARAARDEEEAIDAPLVLDDPEARAMAREAALDEQRWMSALRLELVAELGEAPAADHRAFELEGELAAAAVAAEQHLAADPSDTARYLRVARAWWLAADADRARYYLGLFETLGGDPAEAADLYASLRAVSR